MRPSHHHREQQSSVRRALEELGDPFDVLARHGIEVRGRMARCPLHHDTEPSLSLFTGRDSKERWKCHGCDAGGDALDLEAALSGQSLAEVIKEWAA
jgi:DNA primase